MTMKNAILMALLFGTVAFAGTISGELIYPDGGWGFYIVIAVSKTELAESIAVHGSSFDIAGFLLSMPRDELIMPGPYSIEGDFHDGTAYTVFGFKPEGMEITPGTPMGMSPMDVFTTGGNARDVPVELATQATIGGEISYPGDFPGCKVNVYDVMSGSAVLETTCVVTETDYHLTLPSGFKTLEFYIDQNDNNQWDPGELEPGAYYTDLSGNGFGPFVFVGGGGRFATGVDVVLPPAAVMEKSTGVRAKIWCAGNTLRFRGAGGKIQIYDLRGRLIFETGTRGDGSIDLSALSAGVYYVRMNSADGMVTKKITLVR